MLMQMHTQTCIHKRMHTTNTHKQVHMDTFDNLFSPLCFHFRIFEIAVVDRTVNHAL